MDHNSVAASLAKTYAAITSGKVNISPRNAALFLEAFYSQPNPVDCVTNLAGSKAGLSALQTAIHCDLSSKYLNSHAAAVLQYLQDDDLKVINNSLFLADIITKIVNPPTFWIEFRKAFLQGKLNEAAIHSFAWLLLQLCTLPADDQSARYRQDTDILTILNSLRAASSPNVVALAAKIEDVLNTAQSTVTEPGGKLDNDFVERQHHPGTESVLEDIESFEALCPGGGCALPCQRLAKKRRRQAQADKLRHDTEQKAHLGRIDSINKELEHVRISSEEASNQKEANLESSRAANVKISTLPTGSPTSSYHTPSLTPTPSPEPSTIPIPVNNSLVPPAPSSPIQTKSYFFDNIFGSDAAAVQHVIPTPLVLQKSQAPGKPFMPLKPSPSKQEWQRLQKAEHTAHTDCDAINAIMDMTGLEAIKEQVLKVKARIDTSRRQRASLRYECFNVVFLGNPGTGKTTVARHYAKFLADVGAIPEDTFIETTGARLAHEGVDGAQKLIQGAIRTGGGAIFVDEAYQLTSGNSHGGPAVLDFLLAEMDKYRGTLVFIFAGYNKEMEKFFEHNPGLKSRVPYQFAFADYTDEELMAMFAAMIKKTYSGRMVLEDGIDGLYSRIAIRRLGRRRGRPGFGNARDLEQMFAEIRGRQATRLTKGRREGTSTDDFFMSRDDLIGPNPSTAILESMSWKKLQTLTGLKSVKDSVRSLFSLIEGNYQRELQEKEPMDMSLNRVFLGAPGTGKTSVAKLYGQILADLGLLTNGEVVTKNAADFQGAALGASEANTKAILASTVGKVLIIDETSVIDTIVAEVQNVPGEDRCVLMLGYKDQMIEMFQNVNPGLSRRFKIEDAFNFEDFSDAELLQIIDLKLKAGELDATDSAKKVALELLNRMRNRPNFGNAGEVENLITQAKARCVARRAKLPAADRPIDVVFEPQDFDPDFDRGVSATANLIKLFDDVVGCKVIIDQLKSYQELALVCKKTNKDPRELIPMNFVFTGPSGTGKTTVARKIGQVFYDMGILGSIDVVECSATDLVGQYVGQTGPKTKKLFEKALGKVLFIDEAYRLSNGQYAQEAVDELVGLLTHPSFKSKLIIILAGYEHDINRLLSVNAGLSSRFPDQFVFQNMDADCCMDILRKELGKNKVVIDNLDDRTSRVYTGMKELILDMSELQDWGNARDMITLSKRLAASALLSLTDLPDGANARLSADEALAITKKMLQDRQRRAKVPAKPRWTHQLPEQSATLISPTPHQLSTTTSTSAAPPSSPRTQTPTSPRQPQRSQKERQNASNQSQLPAQNKACCSPGPSTQCAKSPTAKPTQGVQRDPGVSDKVWHELNKTKRAAETIAEKARKEQRELERKVAEQKRFEEAQRKRKLEVEQALATEQDPAQRTELLRQRDEARCLEEAARAAKQKAADEIRRRREAEGRRQDTEQRAQQKLLEMGVCEVGYQWQNMGSYYRYMIK
ncbi:hypothetical protein HYPSUDRAFT_51406 [Hypholoma sublateritium FD-334 SS-4]|uniref:AAA+ ATPase domain-containing protein n=1 Tax=Hypholoma sublateritium (strain FD-334 SS-4) TaxID=945553 RepID=A0A0D2MV85_HYPSF|nr:hypothetical protein HYPSUDRAFT_51406 [Hypholoma sublateritium FD-334 SS-4]